MGEAETQPRRVLNKESMGIAPGLPLEASTGGVEELRRDIQRLMDMEAIRQLKHAYFRCIDTANLAELAEIFHPDIVVHFTGGNYEWKLQGRDEYVESIKKSFHNAAIGHHNAHHPEIQMLSETEATGIWYLADHMWMLNHRYYTRGTALYWDRYLKVDGRWTIRETTYERLFEMSEVLDADPPVTSHYLATHGAPADA